MELGTLTKFLALISSILLTLTTVPVNARAKCLGKWRIHACLSGNGKRSDPRMSSGLNPPSLESRLRQARHLALQSAVQAGYESRQPLSLLQRLQPEPETARSTRVSDNLLASELAAWLQADEDLPRQKEIEPVLEPTENEEEADFSVDDDVTNDETDMTPVDMETVQDIFTALTLQRALRMEGLRKRDTDTRDQIL